MPKDKPPKGGWLGPPPTQGVPAIAIADGSKRGSWKWKLNKLSEKDKKKRSKFEKKLKKADKLGLWRW